ncbi:MAG TPA: site-2 protease family protein [Bacteroidales bacterium]|nr:site-2 protease family protein [Bacteroidales bacterium]
MDLLNLERVLMYLPGIILGLTVHEFSHAWIAHLSGDPTSKEQGRITLNPLKHIDLIGFIFLLVAGFGWAKPVQFNEQNLKRKTDVVKIALAGPLSNAILAIVLSFIFALSARYFHAADNIFQLLMELLYYAILINWGLFIFNLIPLPPLDGSHIFFYPLRRYPDLYNAFYKYGSFLLLGLLLATFFTEINLLPITRVISFFADGILSIFGVH